MPRRIQNTTVPRNPVARSPLLRRGGVHERSRSAIRQQNRQSLQDEASHWRDELDSESDDRSERS
ncbi:MAG: hypothetical protein AAF197_01810 [Pseudomonadota bacterium]